MPVLLEAAAAVGDLERIWRPRKMKLFKKRKEKRRKEKKRKEKERARPKALQIQEIAPQSPCGRGSSVISGY